MPDLIAELRAENAARPPDAPWVVVPREPTLAMMLAAADTRDVMMPGDRAGDWIRRPEDAETVLLPAELVERLGEERALEASVAADAWAGSIRGLEEWLRTRGEMGGNAFSEGWLRPFADRCPEGGWGEGVPPAGEPFSHRVWPKGCDAHSGQFLVAPARAASIMALRAAQATIMALPWCDMDEAVDASRMPIVPGRTREHRFDDEERPWIVMAALWRGAVGHLLSSEPDDGAAVPEHGDAAGFRLCELLAYNVPGSAQGGQTMFGDEPWRGASVRSSSGVIDLALTEGRLSWNWEESGGRGASGRGLSMVHDPKDALLTALRRVCAGDGATLERRH